MPITIHEFAEEHVEAVRRMNRRLSVAENTLVFPDSPTRHDLPKIPGRSLYQQLFVALEDGRDARGAYILKHQEFWIRNGVVPIADYRSPISEGIIDRKYPQVGVQLFWDAMRKQPLLFGLGIGGYDLPLAKMFAAAGWHMVSVPFYFRIIHPAVFLRNITHLRRRPAVRFVLDVLAATRLGCPAIRIVQSVRARAKPLDPAIDVETAEDFSGWADELWNRNKMQYGMSAVRDAENLQILYPRDEKKFIRLKIIENAEIIGWAVLLDTQCAGHKQFGNMRLGSIVDCFSATEDAQKVIGAARRFLERRRVDLILSNQLHLTWQKALHQSGFMPGPSNCIFAMSKKLTELVRQRGVPDDQIHINRGDGDGPINL